jgi:hypothetical protein
MKMFESIRNEIASFGKLALIAMAAAALAALAGCAGADIQKAIASADAGVGCGRAIGTGIQTTVIIVKAEKNVAPAGGSITVKPDCETTITNNAPATPAPVAKVAP